MEGGPWPLLARAPALAGSAVISVRGLGRSPQKLFAGACAGEAGGWGARSRPGRNGFISLPLRNFVRRPFHAPPLGAHVRGSLRGSMDIILLVILVCLRLLSTGHRRTASPACAGRAAALLSAEVVGPRPVVPQPAAPPPVVPPLVPRPVSSQPGAALACASAAGSVGTSRFRLFLLPGGLPRRFGSGASGAACGTSGAACGAACGAASCASGASCLVGSILFLYVIKI